jgi:filamentous hemagglutinin family protein
VGAFFVVGHWTGRAAGARRRGASRASYLRELLGLTALAGIGHAAYAAPPVLPQGGQFVAGVGVIGQAGADALRIDQSTVRGVIDWRSFSIGQGGSVVINNGQGATLNRVTGGQISQIEGRLSATGSVYLVNPQGVVIGPGGKVLGGGSVVVSTRNISNNAFMAGGPIAAAGTSTGDVTNRGQILSQQGDVVLIGRSVSNAGSIEAVNGSVNLAAANSVIMAQTNGASGIYVVPDVSAAGDVTEEGRIKAAAAALTAAGGNVYTLAGNRTDLIEAQGAANIGGQVWLSAPNGQVSIAGGVVAKNADGSGGRIVARGGKSTVLTGVLNGGGVRGGEIFVGVTGPQQDLSASTTVADGAVISVGGPQGGGMVETSGHQLAIGAASVATSGGQWLLDPVNLTIDSASGAVSTIVNALGSSDVTIQTTASGVSNTGVSNGVGTQAAGAGDITVASPITWSTAHSLTLQAYKDLNVNAAVTSSGTGDLALTAGGAIAIGAAVSANTVSMTANGGDLTLRAGGSVTGTAAAVNAVALRTSADFINQAGANAVGASGAGGYWRIYSTDPTRDTPNGLTPDFYQYGLGADPTVLGTGDGLLYSASKTVSYALTGSVTKVYDGTSALAAGSITAGNLSATGLVAGDTAAPTDGSGTLSQSDVGSSLLATLAGVSVTRNGKPVYGYTTSGPIQGVIGSITARPLTVDIVDGPNGVAKIYDGNGTALLNTSNFQISGIAPADSGTISISPGPKAAVYVGGDGQGHAPPDVGSGYGLTVDLISTNFVSTGSIKLTNYILPDRPENDSRAAGAVTPYAHASITPAPLQLLGLTAHGKIYDSTAAATVSATGLSGVVSGDDVTLGGITASFDNGGAAGGGVPVTYQVALTGDANKIRDYLVTLPLLAADIAKAPLTLNGFSVAGGGKVYDGTLAATIDTSLGQLDTSQIFAADRGNVGFDASHVTAQYAQADVGQNLAVTVDPSSIVLTGRGVNYAVNLPALTGAITPRLLTVHLAANAASKTYDGNAIAPVDPAKFSITGWAAGEGGDVSIYQTASAAFTQGGVSQSNAGAYDVTANVTVSDFKVTGSTKLSNYFTSVENGAPVLSATVSAPGGVINRAPLNIQVVGNPTKTYDGTTGVTLAASNFQISGFVNGESATVKDGLVGAFADANAAPAIPITITLNNPTDFNAAPGVLMSNYVFANPVAGFGTINPAPLAGTINASLGGGLTKIYDGTRNIVLGPANFILTGWQNGEGGDVLVTQTAGLFASKDAGSQTVFANLDSDRARAGTATSRGDFTSATTNLLNYTLPDFAAGVGRIDPRAITISIIGSPTKTYNGTLNAPLLTGANYQVLDAASGQPISLVTGETIAVDQPSAFYDNKNVGGRTVSASINPTNLSVSGGSAPLLSNYTLGSQGTQVLQGAALGAGAIDYAQLRILNLTTNNKVYDGATAATFNFSSDDGNLFGVVAGEDVHLDANPGTGTYATIHAGSGLVVTPTQAFGVHGADIGNYQLVAPTLKADITPKTLTVTGVTAKDKVYDATLSAVLDNTGAQLNGVVGSDPVSLHASTSGTFASKHVGSAIAVTASGYGLDFGDAAFAGDYVLQQPGGLAASITPAQLSGGIINTPTKTYDGSTTVTLVGGMGGASSFQITGWQGSDGVGVTIDHAAVAAYLNADAGSQTVDATLLASSFVGISNLYDYYLPFVSGSPSQSVGHIQGAGLINKAPLIAQIVGNPTRVYNAAYNYDSTTDNTGANAGAGLLSGNYRLLGFATGEGADVTVSHANAAFDVKDVGIRTLTASLANGRTDNHHYGDFTAATTNLDNYLLPSTATGAGTITPFHITVGGVAANNKTYDTTGTFTLDNSGATLVNIFSADNGRVSLGAKPTTGASTDGVDVGTHHLSINAGAYQLTGAAAADYVIDGVNWPMADITAAPLTLRVVKTYDGGADAGSSVAGNVYSLVGAVGGDDVGLGANTFAGAYSSAHVDGVRADPTVTLTSGAVNLTGAKAIDYQVTGATGVINPLQLQVTGAVALDKVYDGGTAARISNTSTQLQGLLAGDAGTVKLMSDDGTGSGPQILTAGSITAGTFASKDVGTGVAVTTTNYSLSGNTHGDYTLQQPQRLAANITQAVLALSIDNVTKVYDGTTNLPTIIDAQDFYHLQGVIGGDQVSVVSASGSFDSKDVGTNIGINIVDGSVVLTGADAANYTVQSVPGHAGIGVITRRDVQILATGVDRRYDTTTVAGLTNVGLAARSGNTGFIAGDDVTLTNTATGLFADKNVGANKAIGTSIGATGADAGNYNFLQPTNVRASVTPAPLTLTGVLAKDKQYDATTAATLDTSGAAIGGGILGADTVGVSLSAGGVGAFGDKNVGSGKGVTATLGSFTLTGADAGNYYVDGVNGLSASISKAPLTLAGVTAGGKTYDTTVSAVLDTSGAAVATGVFGGDLVGVARSDHGGSGSFANKAVGTGKTVTANLGSITLTGTDAGNYYISGVNALSADITPAPLLLTGVQATDKVYDALTIDRLDTAGASIASGILAGDSVGLLQASSGATGSFGDKNVGTGKTVTAALGSFTLTGADAGNYSVSGVNPLSASITKAHLTLSGVVAAGKQYDATTAAVLDTTAASLSGVLGGDTVVLGRLAAGGTGTFGDKGVGSGKAVTANLGSFSLGGADGGNYDVTAVNALSASITPAPLVLTGVTARDKVYDATTAATLDTSAARIGAGLFAGDVVGVSAAGGTGAFGDKNAGVGKSVMANLGSLNLTGADAGNYYITAVDGLTASISKALLTLAGVTAVDKVYDATTAATLNTAGAYIASSVIVGDVVNLTQSPTGGTGTFGDKNVGNGKAVSANLGGFGLTGIDAGNYSVGSVNGLSASITPASLTVSGLVAKDKQYDATTAAALDTSGVGLAGLLLGDTVTVSVQPNAGAFGDKNVGANKTVTVSLSDLRLGGGDAGNYRLVGVNGLAADITPAPLTVAGVTADDKVYDATTAATLHTGGAILTGLFAGDNVTLSSSGASGAFGDKNVGAGKAVTVSGYAVFGADAGNYLFTAPSGVVASITPAKLSVRDLAVRDKVYDGSTAAELDLSHVTGSSLVGVIARDDVTLSSVPGAANFVTANAGSNIQVTLSGQAISGVDAGNYVLSSAALPTANITPRPLGAVIVGHPTKVYDGGTLAALTGADFELTNLVGGQAIRVTQTSGAYAGADAGSRAVTANLGAGDFAAGAGTLLSNYILPTSAAGEGLITRRPLGAVIVGDPTKIYDGDVLAALTSANYQLTNFVAGQGAAITQARGAYSTADAGARTITANLASGDFTASPGTLLSNYILPTIASGEGTITPRPLTARIIGEPTKFFDGNADAALTSANFLLTGFVGGQGASVGAMTGTYSGVGPGTELTVTARLGAGDFTALGGANLANYLLPTVAMGDGVIRAPISGDLSSRYENQLLAAGITPTPEAVSIIGSLVFSMATPRIYIPFPAPGALSTWKGNGFGSLPIVVDRSTDYAAEISSDGGVAVQSGPPMINNTEQVLLQGARNKHYRIVLPPQAINGPSLTAH